LLILFLFFIKNLGDDYCIGDIFINLSDIHETTFFLSSSHFCFLAGI